MEGSYIIGADLTTATFKEGQVTDETTYEELQQYLGQIRTAEPNINKIEKNNFSILGIILLITLLLFAFIIIVPLLNKKAD